MPVDDQPLLSKLGARRVRFWVCPKQDHRDRRGPRGELLPTVEWRDDVAYCLTPGCRHTSIDGFSKR